jgi:hypothetical protein
VNDWTAEGLFRQSEELGADLFHREPGHGARLTEVGRAFLNDVREMFGHLDHAKATAQAVAYGKRARLCAGRPSAGSFCSIFRTQILSARLTHSRREGPRVCRLAAGGKRIRTHGPTPPTERKWEGAGTQQHYLAGERTIGGASWPLQSRIGYETEPNRLSRLLPHRTFILEKAYRARNRKFETISLHGESARPPRREKARDETAGCCLKSHAQLPLPSRNAA